jgi:serine/threonine protein kinase
MTTELASPSEALAATVDSLKRAWRAGADPDAAQALEAYPALLGHRSLVVDLAYEEYCLREEAGGTPDPEEFCGRFPEYRSYILEVLRGHRLLADHPELIEAAPRWPRPGDRFEGLTVVRELGRGAFARVSLARDPETGDRPVVLKLSPARSVEARTLGNIRHEHIVSVLWARQVGAMYAICMPFVAAVTLRDAVQAAFGSAGRPRSARTLLDAIAAGSCEVPAPGVAVLAGHESYPEAVAVVAGRLADAVSYLHRAGVAHGDLKPSNVLLGPGGHPYLIDFNLSRSLAAPLFQCGGTLPYMAPERLRQMLGERGEDGPATAADVYAFGVMLFEALTGRVPFVPDVSGLSKHSLAELLRRRGEARSPAAHPHIPRRLARLIDWCLALTPGQRPTIDQVRHEIERYLVRRGRRHVLAASLALMCASSMAWSWMAEPRARVSPPAPTQPAPQLLRTEPDDLFVRGLRHLKAGDVAPAMKDFDDANRLRPGGRNAAYLAYCHALAGQHRVAAGLYREAVQTHGYSAAWVHTNWAYSLTQAAPTVDQLRVAAAEADRAVRLGPTLRAARLNRAYVRFQLSLADPAADRTDPEPVADVVAAMGQGPFTADLYYRAATILVTFGGTSEQWRAQAVRYLAEAVKLGRRPQTLSANPLFRQHLRDREDFQKLFELPSAPPPIAAPDPHLARPPLE